MLNFYAACNSELDETNIKKLREKIEELENEDAIRLLRYEGEAIFFIPTNGVYSNLNQYVLCVNDYKNAFGSLSEFYDGPKSYIINLGAIYDMPLIYKEQFIGACFNKPEF